ncbi:MAG TPA: hypothetical protein VE869_13760 [Gemmatimonas sp.]|nr:hypothetical protein [Gemmatimonas sp.]
MRAVRYASIIFATAATLTGCASDAPTLTAAADAPLFSAMSGGQEQNISVPFQSLVFIPCANKGVGETVVLVGKIHLKNDILFDGNGGLHLRSHFQPQGVSGVGTTTGEKYQGTGVSRNSLNLTAGVTQSSINNYRIIGQRTGNNYQVHQNTHYTVNANGQVTAEVDNPVITCR